MFYQSHYIHHKINNFGADSPTGAGKFNWKEDYFILYGGMDEIVYRF
jgi:hypothetical protein